MSRNSLLSKSLPAGMKIIIPKIPKKVRNFNHSTAFFTELDNAKDDLKQIIRRQNHQLEREEIKKQASVTSISRK